MGDLLDTPDQACQSRIWGGIHISADEIVGRQSGRQVGLWAIARARRFYDGSEVPPLIHVIWIGSSARAW